MIEKLLNFYGPGYSLEVQNGIVEVRKGSYRMKQVIMMEVTTTNRNRYSYKQKSIARKRYKKKTISVISEPAAIVYLKLE